MTNLLAFRRASSAPQPEAKPAVVSTSAPADRTATVVGAPATAAPAARGQVAPPAPPRRRSLFGRARSGDDRVAQLLRSPLLAGWSETDVTALAACADETTSAAGEIIEQDLYPYRWWWLVLEGSVAVSAEGEPATVLGPGHAVGLDRPEDSNRRVTLTALADVKLLVGCRQRVIGAADTNPRIRQLVRASLGR